jgi:hypothetical protein
MPLGVYNIRPFRPHASWQVNGAEQVLAGIRGGLLLVVLWTIIYASCDMRTVLLMHKQTGAIAMGMEESRSLTRQEDVQAPPPLRESENAPEVEGYSLSKNKDVPRAV